MEVMDAVRLAKAHIAELFADEEIEDVGLEEAVFDALAASTDSGSPADVWKITIGFTRPWNRRLDTATMLRWQHRARAYKMVNIRAADGAILSVTDPVLAEPR